MKHDEKRREKAMTNRKPLWNNTQSQVVSCANCDWEDAFICSSSVFGGCCSLRLLLFFLLPHLPVSFLQVTSVLVFLWWSRYSSLCRFPCLYCFLTSPLLDHCCPRAPSSVLFSLFLPDDVNHFCSPCFRSSLCRFLPLSVLSSSFDFSFLLLVAV